MEAINPGDVVILKSEKNKTFQQYMTVGHTYSTGVFHCYWFLSGELKTANIATVSLEKISD